MFIQILNGAGSRGPISTAMSATTKRHFWQSRAVGGFLPSNGAPTRQDLASGSGGGRGGFQAFMLVRPGAAAALVIPRDDASDFNEPMFTPLRVPCPT